jgi:hypothetical protein
MKIQLFKNILKLRIRKLRLEHRRSKNVRSYSDIRNILVFYDPDQQAQAQWLVNAFQADGKRVLAVCYSGKSSSAPIDVPENFRVLRTRDLDWMYRPKAVCISEVQAFHADTLVDISVKRGLILSYLYYFVTADYQIGFKHSRSLPYDLMLERSGEQTDDFFVEQLLFYIKRIRIS